MTPDEAHQCAILLEATPDQIFAKLASAKDTTEAQLFLDEIKKNAHKQLRIQAKTLHPDITQDVCKHNLLKRMILILEELDKTTLDNFIQPPELSRRERIARNRRGIGGMSISFIIVDDIQGMADIEITQDGYIRFKI